MSDAKRCDQCGYLGDEPIGWLHVEEIDHGTSSMSSNVEGDFCSLDCVVKKYERMIGGAVPRRSRRSA